MCQFGATDYPDGVRGASFNFSYFRRLAMVDDMWQKWKAWLFSMILVACNSFETHLSQLVKLRIVSPVVIRIGCRRSFLSPSEMHLACSIGCSLDQGPALDLPTWKRNENVDTSGCTEPGQYLCNVFSLSENIAKAKRFVFMTWPLLKEPNRQPQRP